MSAVAKKLLTPAEYLAQERQAEFRSEYYRGEVFAMAGATYEHSVVKDNLARHLGNRFDGGSWRAITSDMRVKVDRTGLYTYPDIVIVCGKPQFEDDVFDILLNPQAIVEVLSDSSEKYDRGKKFAHFRQIPSLQEYVLVAQDQPLLERYVRQPDESWLMTAFDNIQQTFEFASVPARVPLAEIYAGIEFPESPRAELVVRPQP